MTISGKRFNWLSKLSFISPPGVDRIFLESPGCNQILDMECINFDAVFAKPNFSLRIPSAFYNGFILMKETVCSNCFPQSGMGTVTSLDFSLPDPESESGKIDWPE